MAKFLEEIQLYMQFFITASIFFVVCWNTIGFFWKAPSLFNRSLNKKLDRLVGIVQQLITDLSDGKKIVYKKYFKNFSPKRITNDGRTFLKKNNIDQFVLKCSLFKEDFKGLKDSEIYIKCMNWVRGNTEGKNKIIELVYNNDISKEDSEILLALAIHEKILIKNKSEEV